MLTFKYVARDPSTGEKVKSEIQADSQQAAARVLQKQGLAPIDIIESGAATGILGRLKSRVGSKDKILLSRQLSTLINAGLPLVQSLRTVGNQSQSKALKTVVNQVVADVETGVSLSSAMAKHPRVFNQIYISLIAAGEASGTLDKALERLANQQEKDAEILSKVRGAMIYPAIVVLVMLGVLGFMIIKVLPQVQVLYDGISGAQLPLITRILLAISSFTVKYWWVVLLALGLMVFFSSRWFSTAGGRKVADRAKMHMWPISGLFMKLYMARFARTGTTLVASGVPLLQMLDITANSINNVHIEKSIHNAMDKVKSGKALSESLRADQNFLPLVPDMLQIGEQSGSIEQMLERVATYYEKELDNEIKNISTIIEPVLMVVLGIVAFIIVAAVLLPIYGLAGQNIVR